MNKSRKRRERSEDEHKPSVEAEEQGRDMCRMPIDFDKVKKAFDRDGLVIVPILTADQCDELILEQWRNIILQQPWKEEHRIRIHGSDGRLLDLKLPDDRREFLDIVKKPLSKQRREEFEQGWCLHRGFGACCDPQSFHSPLVWAIRQDPLLYRLASTILDRKELWVDINRSIQKLPGQGEKKFLHWDNNPFAVSDAQVKVDSVCGKVCYTSSRFVAVLGTHTPEFHKEFRETYGRLYPHVKESDSKFALDHQKEDPLLLFQRQQTLPVPAGSLVFWHPQLLHGQAKTPLNDPTEYGCYLGYFPAGARAAYKQKCGVDELEDRLSSYELGKAPKLWPSLDAIHFFPKRFLNFPKILESYVNKLPPGHPWIKTRRTLKGSEALTLEPVLDPQYSPPPLSSLGQLLLGKKPWSGQNDDVQGDQSCKKKRKKAQEPRGAMDEVMGGGAGGEGGCGYNSLSVEARRLDCLGNKVLLVTKEQRGYGLRTDLEVYAQGLEELKWEVRKQELVRLTAGEAGGRKRPHPSLAELRENLRWCNVMVGFEYLGDSSTWTAIEEEQKQRKEDGGRRMKIVFVPNLEYCKESNEATSDTMKHLKQVDVIVAKTECVFHRLHRLFLLRKFSSGLGNLLLIPHTSMLQVPAIERDTRRRKGIIHFHGFSKSKNSLENCKAASILLRRHPQVFDRLVVKCSRAGGCKVCDKIRRALGEEPKLHFIEQELSDEGKFSLYNSCRLALCASSSEGFGHHVLEAAALGCQVVTTDGMPMRSILRHQVALARPQDERGRSVNLGLTFTVRSQEIVRAAEVLLQKTYKPEACQQNLLLRIRDFREHLNHLVRLRSHPSSPPSCSCSQHREPILDIAKCPKCGKRMVGELRPVNQQAPDRVFLLCRDCDYEEKAE